MNKYFLVSFLSVFIAGSVFAQGPIITSWKINTTGAHISKGSEIIIVDVEAVYYDSSYVYVKTSGVPDYYNFGTNHSVNAASDLKEVFRITRSPQKNTGTLVSALNGGQYGVARDGTLIFNGEDARSYNNQNVWHSLAYYFEVTDFDSTWGHSTPTNDYHHHVLDLALQDTTKNMVHSPIQGYALDGFPIYGPFAYKDPNDATSKIIRMTSSYQKRSITDRTTLPDGTTLTTTQYGPALGGQYPLGCYREDYKYIANSGILDDHNGRFCKTPEYPNGIYAYFAILDSSLKPCYPYVFGQSMYGTVDQGNMGPGGGKFTIPANAVKYPPVSGINEAYTLESLSLYPNPASNIIHLLLPTENTHWQFEIHDMAGRIIKHSQTFGSKADIDVSSLSNGVYIIKANNESGSANWVGQLVKN